MKKEEILLIDGSSLLSTNFYATLNNKYYFEKTEEGKQKYLDKLLKTKDGKCINGIYGMTRSIERLLKKRTFTHIVIAWDRSREKTFRRQMYPEYKAQRGKTPKELKEQFQTALMFFNELGIKQFTYEEYEADDIIGTLSKKFANINTYIWTKDQDLLQLADETTKIWLITKKSEEMMNEMGIESEIIQNLKIPINVFEHNPETIKSFYSLYPKQIIDMKALEGDSSDNIPGIKGVGKKTIVPLLQEFDDIEGIYDFLENETVKEMNSLFKELGIRSPLNKMMNKITVKTIIEELVDLLIEKDLVELNKLLSLELIEKDKNELIAQLKILEDKELKEIYKKIKKDVSLKPILDKIGTYKIGKAYTDSLLFKKLTTIKTDIPELNNINLKDIEYEQKIENRKIVYKKYNFKSLLK